jgi:hypothetical protein
MRYWVLHIIIILIVFLFWNTQTRLESDSTTITSMELDSVIVDVDTILNKTIVETKQKIISPPKHTLRMIQVEPIDTTTTDTLRYPMPPPPAPIMIEEVEEEPKYITKRDVKVDTVYRYVYEIQQPIITETPPQSTSILDNINILVTIFGGLLNIIILGFQLRDRKSK